jgi:hypothetical protein
VGVGVWAGCVAVAEGVAWVAAAVAVAGEMLVDVAAPVEAVGRLGETGAQAAKKSMRIRLLGYFIVKNSYYALCISKYISSVNHSVRNPGLVCAGG